MKEMVTSDDYRHMPITTLALFAKRAGKVFAAASTWSKKIRERGWRRPRKRMYPARPKVGVRASAPNEVWHIDVTVIRLLDGTKVFLHGLIDNFSRLYLNSLDNVRALEKLVAFHVDQHNRAMPHSALRAQTPDEV